MQTVFQYVRSEWKFWIYAVIGIFAWCFLTSATAIPTLKAEAYNVGFYQDIDTNKWYVATDNQVAEVKEVFDDVKVVWKGKLQNKPLVLIAGQQGQQCEMVFRLYWFKDNGDFTEYKNFNTCYAKKIDVKVEKHIVRVTLDDKVTEIGVE